jgi:Putative DNA-binding domain
VKYLTSKSTHGSIIIHFENMSALLDKGLKAKRESKNVEFKRLFDPTSPGEWCELIKDIVAMANSGGGVILIGLENNGVPSGINVDATLNLDLAIISDKIYKYTDQHFSEIEIHEAERDSHKLAIIDVAGVEVPIVFQIVGTYDIVVNNQTKQKTAFSRGTVYFRHGAKSEAGTSEDISQVIDRKVKSIRNEWLNGVRKVVNAPEGSSVSISSGEVKESRSPDATPIRLVDDPAAPGYRLIDHDVTYPILIFKSATAAAMESMSR